MERDPMLEVDVSHRLGSFNLDVRFDSAEGLTALFGRSGAGKTSVVNIIGGLIRPDRGRVVVDGRVLCDTQRRIFVPAHRRRIGYVFQEGRLFPHLTVRQNLLYGRWFTPAAQRHERLDDVVDLLGIGHLLGRRPALLSGGEKQRVAIGRALLASPRLLLMDEPLASLDDARKDEILPYIERLRDEIKLPIVYVSHAITEVTRLASTLVVLSGGRVAAAGLLTDIMGRPDLFPLAGRYEAGSVLEAKVAEHDAAFDLTVLSCAAGRLRVPRVDLATGSEIRLRIRARDIIVAVQQPQGLSALNVLPGRLAEIGPLEGPIVEVRIDLNGQFVTARITRKTVHDLQLAPGREVFVVIKTIALDHRSLGLSGRPHDTPQRADHKRF
jgi:molybdate transport system ATP-binding protein